MPRFLLSVLVCSISAQAFAAGDASYEIDVRPILKAHCFQCHGEDGKAEGSLDLRLRRFIVTGGDSGPAVLPGNVVESLLIQRVTAGEMPPAKEKHLSTQEIEILTRWVAADAPTLHQEPESLDNGSYFTEEERIFCKHTGRRRYAPNCSSI